MNQGYNKISIDQHFSKVKAIDRNELLKEKGAQNKTPLVSTYNHFLPNISNIV